MGPSCFTVSTFCSLPYDGGCKILQKRGQHGNMKIVIIVLKKIKPPPPKKNGLTLVTFVKHSIVHDGTLWIDLLI